MTMPDKPNISVIVPVYNEAIGLGEFNCRLFKVLDSQPKYSFEVIYCNDGSEDETADVVSSLRAKDKRVRLISFSRNFGKENALLAGIEKSRGEAVITIDGDGQHPVELIPKFLQAWQNGSQVVVGVRTYSKDESFIKRLGSKIFYKTINLFLMQKLKPGSTDYRLIDAGVRKAFLQLKESERITRGLIDWLGFKPKYIKFVAEPRRSGQPGYSFTKLAKLAANSMVSLSPRPLYLCGYLGVTITFGALIVGASVALEQIMLGDPLGWRFTGTAMLGILTIFLVGILLAAIGILSLYIAHIHSQTKDRPLYVVDYKNSHGVEDDI